MLMAHKPSFAGVEEVQWGDVAKTFVAYRDGFYAHTDAERPEEVPAQFPDAPAEMREWISGKALLYDEEAETFSDAFSLWVVNPETDKLNGPGLRNALARASQVEGVSTEEIASAQEVGRELLSDEFADESEDDLPEDPSQSVEMSAVDEIKAHLDAAMALLLDMTTAEPVADPAPDEEPAMESFAEMDAPIVRIVEQDAPANRRAPLTLEVALIQVGPGNAHDNNYYTREMLERDGGVFAGVTMHTVDHREEQRSEGTDVSTVKEVLGVNAIDGDNYLVARVQAYDPGFCEKTRNRAAAGELDKLQCSILAIGKAVKGEIDGQEYNVVQEITEARFVDWVTRAGAGGHALRLAENEPDEDEEEITEGGGPETVVLSEDDDEGNVTLTPLEVMALVENKAPHLTVSSMTTLLEGVYTTPAEVDRALTAEIDRLKGAGSGQPFAMGAIENERPASIEEVNAGLNQVNTKWIGGR